MTTDTTITGSDSKVPQELTEEIPAPEEIPAVLPEGTVTEDKDEDDGSDFIHDVLLGLANRISTLEAQVARLRKVVGVKAKV